jgi:hypothetical protein
MTVLIADSRIYVNDKLITPPSIRRLFKWRYEKQILEIAKKVESRGS